MCPGTCGTHHCSGFSSHPGRLYCEMLLFKIWPKGLPSAAAHSSSLALASSQTSAHSWRWIVIYSVDILTSAFRTLHIGSSSSAAEGFIPLVAAVKTPEPSGGHHFSPFSSFSRLSISFFCSSRAFISSSFVGAAGHTPVDTGFGTAG